MRRSLKIGALVLFSAGWLYPATLAVDAFLDSLERYLWYIQTRQDMPAQSISQFLGARLLFEVTCLWLALVIAAWVILLMRRRA